MHWLSFDGYKNTGHVIRACEQLESVVEKSLSWKEKNVKLETMPLVKRKKVKLVTAQVEKLKIQLVKSNLKISISE